MPKVDEAVGLVGFGASLVHWQPEVVEVILVDFLKVLLDLIVSISARNVLHH